MVMRKLIFNSALRLFIMLQSFNIYAQQKILAFPTAEGYGKYTVGGRGGKVYHVENLNDSGTGSLRDAVEASGPRTVVFDVSGTIILEKPLKIKNPNLTIAGQTAPGDGICLRKNPLEISADQVIIRYIRVRLGNESGNDADAISGRFQKNIILDHLSASWSVDETLSVYHCDSLTVQWCIIAESLYNGHHIKGVHGFGGIWGASNSSYHHNLLAHHSSRNPRIVSGCGNTDFRNNVIYNWGYNSTYGGENAQVGDQRFSASYINLVANFYKPGPATLNGKVSYRIANPAYRDNKTDYGKWYIAQNVMFNKPSVTGDNWDGGVQPKNGNEDLTLIKAEQPAPFMPINQHSPTEAYELVLDKAGANFPQRDEVDTHIIKDTRTGTASFEGSTYKNTQKITDKSVNTGIIDSPSDVGGWPNLKSKPAPVDSDRDGMPDTWEKTNGLNPNDANDGNKKDADGYTMLEKYLNSLV